MEINPSQVRLDRWVKQQFPQLSNRHVDEALDKALISSKSLGKLTKGQRLREPVEIDFSKLTSHLEQIRQGTRNTQVKVVETNAGWVAVDKPAGMHCHPISLFDTDTLTHWAFAELPETREAFLDIQPEVTPHRLDFGTSGIVIVARHKPAFDYWRELFSKKQVHKKYRALCWGNPEWDEKELSLYIGHDPKDSRKMTVDWKLREGTKALPALTRVKVIERRNDGTFLVDVTCETGVTHQIRVHLASEGFPLVGDSLYDPAFEGRALKPPYHQLRAYELQAGELHIKIDPNL